MRVIKQLLSTLLIFMIGIFPLATPLMAGQSDVDLFTLNGRLQPNILIVLDSSGSMNDEPAAGGGVSKKQMAIDALTKMITDINRPIISGSSTTYEENARFGLHIFRENGAELLNDVALGNTQMMLDAVRNHPTTSVGTPISAAILDVGRYYASDNGWDTLKKYGSGMSGGGSDDFFDYYCRDTFAIFITDGQANRDLVEVDGFWETIGDYDGDAGVGENGVENEASLEAEIPNVEWSDDITQAMFERDFAPLLDGKQNVTTHVIGFDVDTPNLVRMATQGGGMYETATTASSLSYALKNITDSAFDSLASYSTAVVPTSRNAFGSSFYNAFFNPVNDGPFWEGHIEAYDLSPTGVVLDAAGSPAVNPGTDEFDEPHNPHWDAGIRLRTNSSRSLYTTLLGLRTPFAPGAAIQAELGINAADISRFPNSVLSGITTTPQAEVAVINYLTGQDAFDEDSDANFVELRDTVLGDIFHSTPVIVGPPTIVLTNETGYNAFLTAWAGRQRIIYAGANDAMFHGFDAGSLTVGDNPLTPAIETNAVYYTPGTGDEKFGYVPGLLLDEAKLVAQNKPRRYYFVDGSPVVADVWLRTNSADYTRETDEWTTVSIVGFREGGAGYLALDITDPSSTLMSDPHGPYPKLLFEFTDSKLGEAWSQPVITRVKVREGMAGDVCGHDNGDGNCRERWVAIFGGGYETTTDPNHGSFTSNTAAPQYTVRSKAIYMVDLATGMVLDKIEFDAATNPNMIYGLPSEPAVLDTNFDGFADVVYIGDLGGQVWKWDISALGEDSSGADGIIDNWPHGIFFTAPVVSVAGDDRYKSFFYPPVAGFAHNVLRLAFASGERDQLHYAGPPAQDENNRLYVVKDYYPTGFSAFASTFTEANLTDITGWPRDNDPSDQGYYFVALDGEKFVSDLIMFAGYVVFGSFQSNFGLADPCEALNGLSRLYAFEVGAGAGYFTANAFTSMEERYTEIGGGMAAAPRISMAPDGADDKMYIKTSKGRMITRAPPPRDGSSTSIIYWKQNQ